MKKLCVLVLGLLFICSLGGCSPQKDTAAATPLTDEELAFFNGTEFFNQEADGNAVGFNIRNQFLSSTYDEAKNINLFELFYSGTGLDDALSNEESLAAMESMDLGTDPERLNCALRKISVANMNAILLEHMSLALKDTAQVGLDGFGYASAYEAYYTLHGDTNYRSLVHFSRGEREGDLLRLFYTDDFFADGEKVLTLQEKEGSYLFISNQAITPAS